jgi:hypothetical protein
VSFRRHIHVRYNEKATSINVKGVKKNTFTDLQPLTIKSILVAPRFLFFFYNKYREGLLVCQLIFNDFY